MTAKTTMVLDAVAPLLAKIGFRKRAGEIFTVELSKDVLGWLGLNRATKHRVAGEVEINPVVGVRHQEVERMVAELRGEKVHAYQPPTIGTHLGYLLPEARYKSWVFTADRAKAMADEMAAAIAEHGLAFMQSMKGLGELCRAIEERSGLAIIESQAVYRRPVVWLLSNDARRAAEELDKALAVLGERSDMAATDFRRFAAAIRTRLAAS